MRITQHVARGTWLGHSKQAGAPAHHGGLIYQGSEIEDGCGDASGVEGCRDLGIRGTRYWRGSELLGAAFDDGPHLTGQHPAVWIAFSHFNRGGLVMRDKPKFNSSYLPVRNRIGHTGSGDVELQLIWPGIEAKVIWRFHRFYGPVHAVREIRRRSWKISYPSGLCLTNIGQARHAGGEQARQTNDSKTFQRQPSTWEILWQSRYEKNK